MGKILLFVVEARLPLQSRQTIVRLSSLPSRHRHSLEKRCFDEFSTLALALCLHVSLDYSAVEHALHNFYVMTLASTRETHIDSFIVIRHGNDRKPCALRSHPMRKIVQISMATHFWHNLR